MFENFLLMVSLNGINYSQMQQLHLIGSQMNIHSNHHTSCILNVTLTFPPLAALLQAKLQYLGLDEGMIHLEKLRQA